MRARIVALLLMLLVTGFALGDVLQPWYVRWNPRYVPSYRRQFDRQGLLISMGTPILIQAHDGPARIVVPRNMFPGAKPFASRVGTGAIAVAALLPLAFCLRRRGRALLLLGVLLLTTNAVVPLVGANPVVPGEPLSPHVRQLKARPKWMTLDGVSIEIVETGDRIVVQVPREKLPASEGR